MCIIGFYQKATILSGEIRLSLLSIIGCQIERALKDKAINLVLNIKCNREKIRGKRLKSGKKEWKWGEEKEDRGGLAQPQPMSGLAQAGPGGWGLHKVNFYALCAPPRHLQSGLHCNVLHWGLTRLCKSFQCRAVSALPNIGLSEPTSNGKCY